MNSISRRIVLYQLQHKGAALHQSRSAIHGIFLIFIFHLIYKIESRVHKDITNFCKFLISLDSLIQDGNTTSLQTTQWGTNKIKECALIERHGNQNAYIATMQKKICLLKENPKK